MLDIEQFPPAPLDNLLTEKQLCAWLGIAPATCSRWRLEGSGPPFIALGPRRLRINEHRTVGQPYLCGRRKRTNLKDFDRQLLDGRYKCP
jgi:hypothetical protein